ncbi:MAG: peptide chain release factor H [Alphaproteobacteria bacterium]
MTSLLLTSGRGPAECRIALRKVLTVMAAEAEAVGLALDVATGPAPDAYGPGSAVVVIEGAGAETFARSWTGSVLWVAKSPVRPHHKRKNWFIGVFQLPQSEAAPLMLKAAEVRFEAFRAGGPGGQHQNKTESAVRAVHIPTGLAVVARDERSQHRNKAAALRRLGELIRLGNEITTLAAREAEHANHDRLERGRPVRSFQGEDFVAK